VAPEGLPQREIGVAAGLPVRGEGQGLFQQAQHVGRRCFGPGVEPLVIELLPELVTLLALQRQQVAFPDAVQVAEPGHQEAAAQDFPGTFQNDIAFAVAEDRGNLPLKGLCLRRAGTSGLLPGKELGRSRDTPSLEDVERLFYGLKSFLTGACSKQGRQERRNVRMRDFPQPLYQMKVPGQVVGPGKYQGLQFFRAGTRGQGLLQTFQMLLQSRGVVGRN
jgi:hypothetical protein